MMPNVRGFIEATIDLAEADLKAGATDRVEHHLQTIRLLLDRIDGMPGAAAVARPKRVSGGGRPRTEEGRAIEAAVTDILSDGAAWAISDIMDELKRRGIPIPGQGRAANLIAHLRRMPNVERLQHGVYGRVNA